MIAGDIIRAIETTRKQLTEVEDRRRRLNELGARPRYLLGGRFWLIPVQRGAVGVSWKLSEADAFAWLDGLTPAQAKEAAEPGRIRTWLRRKILGLTIGEILERMRPHGNP
jgi:hypothetical protein